MAMARSLAAAAALLPLAGAVLLQQAPASDPCACVNWKQAYRSGGARCGDGHELYAGTSSGQARWKASMVLGLAYCMNFYEVLDDDFCVNVDQGNEPDAWYGRQWCYTSGECASASRANGTGSLRVKLCTEGKDELLRDRTPGTLFAMAEEGLDVALLLRMAYPVEKRARWPLVRDALLNPSAVNLAADGPRRAEYRRLAELQASGRPVVLDSNTSFPPFGLVRGATAYLVQLAKSDIERPFAAECVAGCGQ